MSTFGGFTYVWEFRVPPEKAGEFERHYGSAGTWVQLFSRAAGYRQTLLLKDRQDAGRYLTVDRWDSEAAYRAFQAAHAREYADLDRQCASLTTGENSVGDFAE